MKVLSSACLVAIACVTAAGSADGLDLGRARARGWVSEVQPTHGQLRVRIEERGAWRARTFRLRADTGIVRYHANDKLPGEPSLPISIVLTDLSVGDQVIVSYRLENGRYVATFVEKRD